MHDEAIADFDEVIRLTPSDPGAYVDRGIEWVKDAIAGRYVPDKAIADFSRAIDLDPKSRRAYVLRINAWKLKNDFVAMARDLESMIQLDAGDPDARRGSHAFWRRARTRECGMASAIGLATSACERTQWKNSGYLDTLAAAYAEAGDFEAAIKWETKAIDLIAANRALASSTDTYGMRDRLKCYQRKEACRE